MWNKNTFRQKKKSETVTERPVLKEILKKVFETEEILVERNKEHWKG